MTIKNTALCFSILLASFSLQGAYNAYGYGPTPPPTFVDPRDRVDSPPSYKDAVGAVPYVPAVSRVGTPIIPEESFLERIGTAYGYMKDDIQYRLEDCSKTQVVVGTVCAVAAAYGLYRSGLATYATRKTASAMYAISRLTGAAAGYSLSAAGAAISRFPAIFGSSLLAAGTYIGARAWANYSSE